MKRRLLLLILIAIALPAFSHLPQFTRQTGGSSVGRDRWPSGSTPTWNLNPSLTGTNISVGASTPAEVVTTSFATWSNAPGSALTILRGGDTTETAPAYDCVNTIAFKCTSGCDFGTDDSTLAITFTTTSDGASSDRDCDNNVPFLGQILDSDILFNQNVSYTTGGGSGQDLQTIATHEIGHFLGLDHSAIVKSMMFPFAPDRLVTLSYDDAAGIDALYPVSGNVSDECVSSMGVISGNVTFASSGGVFGAHVFAGSTTDAVYAPWASLRKSPIGAVTRSDGSYCITGLPPDTYLVTAEPLDGPMTNDEIGNYADNFGRTSVQTNFLTRWH
jgi:hypothetical protein